MSRRRWTSPLSSNNATRRATQLSRFLGAAGESIPLRQGVTGCSSMNTAVLPVYCTSCDRMTSSAKPEIHNVLHCHQKKTEPRQQVTCTDNFVKFGVWFTYERTDRPTERQTNRQTYRHANRSNSLSYRGRNNYDTIQYDTIWHIYVRSKVDERTSLI